MSSRSRWLIFIISTPLVVFVTVGGLMGASRPPTAAQQAFPYLRTFEEVFGLISQAYVEPVDVDKVMEGAMHGLADGLDASSAYLTPDEVRAIDTHTALATGDVGLTVTRQFYLRVVGVRDGSPAAKAGLQTGDFIRMIDNKPARDMSAVTGMRVLHGAPGSKVSLTIIRGNAADPHVFDLVRENPSGESATMTTLANGIARVRVASFGPTTAATLKKIFDGLAAAKSPGAVIDLRGTADGSAEDGIAAARLFVKSGTLAIRAGRDAAKKTTVTAAAGDGAVTLPVALLVSNGTGNAAEIFAGALSGNNRAELVGEPTAGIAGVQTLVRLPQNYGLWLTTERYMTVDGKDPIHERGLRPTLGVAIPTVGFDEVPPTTDEPLAKAADRLRSKK
jgi:carboxyl-terminal processing protease